MESITGLTLSELEHLLVGWQEKIFRASQIFSWLYKKGTVDFNRMSNLSETLRKKLADNFVILNIELIKTQKSTDGTEKFLFALKDRNLIEAVLIPAEGRVTACVSTQVGCKYGCSFCASGMSGFKRNLDCAEMMQQVLCLKNHIAQKSLTHIVLMGTGEPLDNYDNVIKAVRIINSKEGMNIGARRVTISTSGVIPSIKKLSGEKMQVELSVSLHSADEKKRSQIMPVNRAYPLKELIPACREYISKTGRQITFEYVMIKGLNSDLESAQKLTRLLKELRLAKANLIPANPVRESGIEPPGKLEILFFKDYLLKHGVKAILRRSRGADIDAACGQLRLRHEKK